MSRHMTVTGSCPQLHARMGRTEAERGGLGLGRRADWGRATIVESMTRTARFGPRRSGPAARMLSALRYERILYRVRYPYTQAHITHMKVFCIERWNADSGWGGTF
jgi:hypothetical protein